MRIDFRERLCAAVESTLIYPNKGRAEKGFHRLTNIVDLLLAEWLLFILHWENK